MNSRKCNKDLAITLCRAMRKYKAALEELKAIKESVPREAWWELRHLVEQDTPSI